MTSHLLALDTSERRASLAVATWSPTGPIHVAVTDEQASHGRDLVPTLDALLGSAGIGLGSIDTIVVGRGPGSYTGLRVGVATAIGLARPRGLTCIGIPSVEGIAAAFLEERDEIAIVLDARRGSFHFARYRRDPSGSPVPRVMVEPCLVAGKELPARLEGTHHVYVDPPGVTDDFVDAESFHWIPRGDARLARHLLDIARHSMRSELEARRDTSPLYLRGSSAEERRNTT